MSGTAAQRGSLLLAAHLRGGEPGALDHAVEQLRQGVRETPPGTRAYVACLGNLLAALALRCTAVGDPRDLADLVAYGRVAAAGSPRQQDLALLGQALVWSHERTGAPGELDEAVEVYGRAAEVSGTADDLLPVLINRAAALIDRYERTGRPPDLAAAEADLRRGLRLPDVEPGTRARLLANLASVRKLRHEADGDPAALAETVALSREAAACLPAGAPEQPVMLGNLALVLMTAAGAGTPGAAVEGVRVCREALALTPAGRPERGALLHRLGALLRLAVEAGELGVTALDEAVTAARQAVRETPAGHPQLPDRLQGLGNVLHRRSETAEEPGEWLDEAIDCLRRAVAGFTEHRRPDGDRDRARGNLAVALRRRHLATLDLASLREAVALVRRLMGSATAPARHHRTLANASVVLQSWATATRDPEAAREGVDAARAALSATPDDPAAVRADRLNTLANALVTLYECAGAPAGPGSAGDRIHVLDEAIALLERAAALLPPDAPDFARTLSNLGGAWRRKAESTGELAATEQAVAVLGRAVAAGDRWPDRRASYEANHADALRLLYETTGDPGVLRAAARGRRRAALTVEAPPLSRAMAALAWGDDAAEGEGPAAALEAYRLAVRLLPRVAPRHLTRRDQQEKLARLGGLAARAAACALDVGDVRLAVRLLEQGRGTLLGHLFESRGEVAELRRAHPAAAARLTALRDRMDRLSLGADDGLDADERHALGARWDAEVARVRELPGFAGFLALPSLDELLACADEGPVVLLYGGPRRGDALILRGSPGGGRERGEVRHVPLPGMGEAVVERQAARFHEALAASRSPDGERDAGRVLREVLAWLWDGAVGPVLDALGPPPAGPGPLPRVWWSPGGALTALPLHAAGHHGDPARTALDRVVSSYTPTLRALRHARSREEAARAVPAAGTDVTTVLAVASGDAPGVPALPGAEREVDALRRLLPTRVLSGRDATFDAVYGALPRHAHAHFACHGVSDPADPSTGRLLVHDHAERPLTVRDISRLDLSGARLAVLSACETSRADGRLADEAIHITSAFQVAGYPHVVGTLWPVHDAVARRTATVFYRELLGGPGAPTAGALDAGRAAEALHRAVCACRRRYPASPSLWAAHVHAGA
ncbi:CHAT domain-containing protein [Streptomyces sp. NPDC017936]|uniref:CHAT domain-containing protein n=1 Tax=Streptomyces sp. NPDC017936 TaxID=3365016 RepID=UPI0037B52E2E